jgi:hypothetical protein
MGTTKRILAGLAGTTLATVMAFGQAPQQQPAGREGAAAPAGAQQPARGGEAAPQQPQGRGGRGGQPAGPPPMSFFVTSVGKGDGGNLGGLAGADAHCAALAQASGLPPATGRTWRAYLSAGAANGQPAVNARDRIGVGPWYNAKGVLIANNVADLHGDIERDRNAITKGNALTEKGMPVNGVGDQPNQHDMLTGSDSVGRAIAGTTDTTCSNWTSNVSPPPPAPVADARGDGVGDPAPGGRPGGGGRAGAAANASTNSGPGVILGHADRQGGANTSWNSAHRSRGCSQSDLVATGGAGLFYCFAAN